MADAVDPTVFVPPPQVPLPPVRTIASEADPEDPYQLPTQLQMEDALMCDGWAGLTRVIYKIALDEKRRSPTNFSASWDKLRFDSTSGNNYVYHLLRTCSVEFLRSIIRNTLVYDSRHDIDLRAFIKKRIAWEGPGIYANCTGKGGSVLIDEQTIHPHLGRWLSKAQIDRLLAEVETYIADEAADQKENVEIDEFFKAGWTDRPKRRYCSNDVMKSKYEIWIATIRQQFCTGLDPSKEDIPFMRSPMEIGWASHLTSRLQHHVNNGSTTNIYGLVNVLTRKLFGFTKVKQFVIFPVWEPVKMPQIAEILATILCNAYYYNGGLNHYPAGVFDNKTIKRKYVKEWQTSAQVAYGPYENSEDLDLVRSTARQASVEKAALLNERKNEYERLRAKLVVARQEFIELREERANRRLKEPEPSQAPGALPDPLRSTLMSIVADANLQAEAKEVVEDHLKFPGLPLPRDPRLANAVNARLKRIRDIVEERMPSAIVDPDAVTPADLPKFNTDLSEVFRNRGPWDEIEQVADSSVQGYDSDSDRGDGETGEEAGDGDDTDEEVGEGDEISEEDSRSDTAEKQGSARTGSESPSGQLW